MDFALIPESVPRAIEEAKSRGLVLNGPIDGGRVRPDGRELRWQTARQATFDLPFLCGDITPREWRVPEGEARRHANGKSGIARVTVAVDDVAESMRRYEALLGRVDLAAPDAIRIGSTIVELIRKARPRGEGPDAIALR